MKKVFHMERRQFSRKNRAGCPSKKNVIFEQDFIDFIEVSHLQEDDQMIVVAHSLAYHC